MIRIVYLLILLLVGFTAPGCVDESTDNRFILSISVDVATGVEATSIRLTPGSIRLHVAGTPRSAGWTPEMLNDAHWTPIGTGNQTIDLLEPKANERVDLVNAIIPDGTYDHLYLEVEALEATDETGATIPCKNVIEPIAIDLSPNEGKTLAVNLELFIAADWPEDGHCSVLAKDASILETMP